MTARILVLDDDALLAFDTAMTLEDAGYAILGPFNTLVSAQDALRETPPNAAVIDLKLGQETSLPLARQLSASGIPFIVLSGHSASALPDELRDTPWISKPYLEREFIRKMEEVLE